MTAADRLLDLMAVVLLSSPQLWLLPHTHPYKVNLFNISAFGVATPYPYKVSLFNILAFGGHLQVPLFQLRSQMQLMAVVGEETTFLHSILA